MDFSRIFVEWANVSIWVVPREGVNTSRPCRDEGFFDFYQSKGREKRRTYYGKFTGKTGTGNAGFPGE